ncbi:hypothetical protein EV401DRAFT_690662 [Pisolithus croceorrhizus]|nr:hypothetical protein EV401DRAFT_690662 [Pisolithus croceorrhizus]
MSRPFCQLTEHPRTIGKAALLHKWANYCVADSRCHWGFHHLQRIKQIFPGVVLFGKKCCSGNARVHILTSAFRPLKNDNMGTSDSFGPALIGGLVSAILYGVATLQGHLRVLLARLRGCPDHKVPRCCRMDSRYPTYLVRLSRLILLPDNQLWCADEFGVYCLASVLVNVLVIFAVQCFFTHQIYHLYRSRVKWWVTVPIILSVLAEFGFGMETAILELVNHEASIVTRITFYGVTPAVAIMALAEVLITISLCVLLYDRGSSSALPRTKRLLKTLIIYAVNRCSLILLVATAMFAMVLEAQDMWFLALSFVIGKLYTNSFLASLNSREHLRSHGAGTPPDLRIGVVRFANPPKFLEDIESFKKKAGIVDVPEVAVIDVTIDLTPDKTTML